MSNPYEAFNISDDEEQHIVANKTEKPRKTHKERREMKKQSEITPTTENTQVAQELPSKVKQDAKAIRRNRNHGRPNKEIPQGHTLDRRSGTGRVDRPRKDGASRGGFGTVKDELNKEQFEKPEQQVQVTTEEAPVEQKKPEEPQKLTLAEYYQNKGIDLSQQAVKKAPVKNQINAEWLKKQKLTLIETKEDKKRQQTVKQSVLQQNNTRVQSEITGAEHLGFGSKPVQKPREQPAQEKTQNNHRGQKGKKGPQVVLKEDDFPTL